MQNDKRHAELSRQVAVVAVVILFPMVNLVWAERSKSRIGVSVHLRLWGREAFYRKEMGK